MLEQDLSLSLSGQDTNYDNENKFVNILHINSNGSSNNLNDAYGEDNNFKYDNNGNININANNNNNNLDNLRLNNNNYFNDKNKLANGQILNIYDFESRNNNNFDLNNENSLFMNNESRITSINSTNTSNQNITKFYLNLNEKKNVDLKNELNAYNQNNDNNSTNNKNLNKRNSFLLDKYSSKQKLYVSSSNTNTTITNKKDSDCSAQSKTLLCLTQDSNNSRSLSSSSTSSSSSSPLNNKSSSISPSSNSNSTDSSFLHPSPTYSPSDAELSNAEPILNNHRKSSLSSSTTSTSEEIRSSSETNEKEEKKQDNYSRQNHLLAPINTLKINISSSQSSIIKKNPDHYLSNIELLKKQLLMSQSNSRTRNSSTPSSPIKHQQKPKEKSTPSTPTKSLNDTLKFPKANDNLIVQDQTKVVTFNAALIHQKSMLKKSLTKKEDDHDDNNRSPKKSTTNLARVKVDSDPKPVYTPLPLSLLDQDENDLYSNSSSVYNTLKSKLESSQLSLVPSKEMGDDVNNNNNNNINKKSTNSMSNLLIVSRQGTVRGSVNQVKTSLKQLFKEQQHNPVELNTQAPAVELNINSSNSIYGSSASSSINNTLAKHNDKSTSHYFLAVSKTLLFLYSFLIYK